jgi:hypothetical protein
MLPPARVAERIASALANHEEFDEVIVA